MHVPLELAHTLFARLQYDLPNPENKHPMRWQFFSEAARSFAQPSQHDFHGAAVGFGNALRLIPQKLTLQTQAGVSYEEYPRFTSRSDGGRRGWNAHAATALVWTPSKHFEISLGVEFMHSAESGRLFQYLMRQGFPAGAILAELRRLRAETPDD